MRFERIADRLRAARPDSAATPSQSKVSCRSGNRRRLRCSLRLRSLYSVSATMPRLPLANLRLLRAAAARPSAAAARAAAPRLAHHAFHLSARQHAASTDAAQNAARAPALDTTAQTSMDPMTGEVSKAADIDVSQVARDRMDGRRGPKPVSCGGGNGGLPSEGQSRPRCPGSRLHGMEDGQAEAIPALYAEGDVGRAGHTIGDGHKRRMSRSGLQSTLRCSAFPASNRADENTFTSQVSQLEIELTKNPKEIPETSKLVFGRQFTDHSACLPDILDTCVTPTDTSHDRQCSAFPGTRRRAGDPPRSSRTDPSTSTRLRRFCIMRRRSLKVSRRTRAKTVSQDCSVRTRWVRKKRGERTLRPGQELICLPLTQNMERMVRSAGRLAFPVCCRAGLGVVYVVADRFPRIRLSPATTSSS